MKNRLSKKAYSTKSSFLPAFLLISVAVIGTAFFSYHWYQKAQLTTYLAEVDKIQAEANSKIIRLDYIFKQFKLDPRVAKEVLPYFKQAQRTLDKTMSKLQRIEPPAKAGTHHKKLLLLYGKSSKLCDDLASVAGYIKARNKLLVRLFEDVQRFSKAIKDAKTDEDAVEAAKALKKSAEFTSEELHSLSAPVKIYSSNKLEQNLDDLAANLAKLEDAIEKKDLNMLQESANGLKSLFSKDWSETLVEVDAKGVGAYKKRIEELQHLKTEVMKARADIQ